jgi:hypothetical protein
VNLLSLPEKLSCHAFVSNLQMIILFILLNYVVCMISLRKSDVEKIMISLRKFEK